MALTETKPAVSRYPTVIANGASESGVIPVLGQKIVAIQMPAAWTAAALTFLCSDSATGTFQAVYDDGGTEVTVASANAVAGRNIVNGTILQKLNGLLYVKVRSGTSGTPVNQGADRALVVTVSG